MEVQSYVSYCNINRIDFGENFVIFLFGGEWCLPCKNMSNSIEKIENTVFYKINVENEDFEDFIFENNIVSIPHAIAKYKTKEVVIKGEKSPEELYEILNLLKC